MNLSYHVRAPRSISELSARPKRRAWATFHKNKDVPLEEASRRVHACCAHSEASLADAHSCHQLFRLASLYDILSQVCGASLPLGNTKTKVQASPPIGDGSCPNNTKAKNRRMNADNRSRLLYET